MAKYITYGLIILSAFIISCKKMPPEPDCDPDKDPECMGYNNPKAQFLIAPTNGQIIDTNMISFKWTGVNTNSNFSYKLSNNNEYSAWTKTREIIYNCLSDGDYTFYVKEKYPNGHIQETETYVSFTIDHIFGPGIVLEQQCIETMVDDTFNVFVSLEDVEAALGVKVFISFKPEIINLIHIDLLSGIISESLSDVVSKISKIDTVNINGLIEINIARFGGDAGSADKKYIARLKFRAIAPGNTEIILNRNSAIRDESNDTIEILKLVNANVTVL